MSKMAAMPEYSKLRLVKGRSIPPLVMFRARTYLDLLVVPELPGGFLAVDGGVTPGFFGRGG